MLEMLKNSPIKKRSFHTTRLLSKDSLSKISSTSRYHTSSEANLKVSFVHTPMSSVNIPGRDEFWFNFDKRYYAVHQNSNPIDAGIWELPHWMTWLGGVLQAEGFKNVNALSLYTAVNIKTGIDRNFIASEIDKNPADVYLYSPMTPNLHLAYEIASMIKSQYPKSVNVFGGVIASPLHNHVGSHPSVDYVVRDRGEFALPALLRAIAGADDIENIKNLTFKHKDGQIRSNPNLYPYMDPQNIPFPLYDLFPQSIGERLRYIRQNYALGCPFKCSFCTIQTIGRKTGYFPIGRVLEEIKAYRSRYGQYHTIYFGDETFTLDNKRTIELCEALQKEGNITYDIQTRLMSLNNEAVLRNLRDSGCKWVEVGIETMVQKSMHLHKQSTNISKTKDILRRLRDYDLPVCSFIVNGFPEQSIDEMRSSIDIVCELLDENLLHASYFFGLVPYPGSLMYEHPEKYGIKIKHHEYQYYNEDLEPVYETVHASSEAIYKVFLEGVKKIGKAMENKPYLGKELSKDKMKKLGKSLTHV